MNWIFITIIILFFLWIPGSVDLIIDNTINQIACFFSRSMRIKRWEGYSGLLYTERPIMTRSANRLIEHIKKEGSDIHTEMRKARKTGSKYFIDETTMKRFPELEPTEQELGISFKEIIQHIKRKCFDIKT